jgi:negative regulator of flagellin synthesis FlgM
VPPEQWNAPTDFPAFFESRLKLSAKPPLYSLSPEESIMKINQNVTILNNGISPASMTQGKVKAAPAEAPAATGPLRQPSSASLLPSVTGDFDAARVAEIRASISAGRYQVDPAKIADGLLSTVRELLNKTSA